MIPPLTQYASLSFMTTYQMTQLSKKKTIQTKKSSISSFPEAYCVEISEQGRALAAKNRKESSFIAGQ